MSVYWFLAIKIGIDIAAIWLMTILVRRLLSKRGVGGFTCFVISLGALSIPKVVAAILATH
jgi:hypothetical protein